MHRCENVYIIGTLRDTAVTPTTVFDDLQMDRSLLDANWAKKIWTVKAPPFKLIPVPCLSRPLRRPVIKQPQIP